MSGRKVWWIRGYDSMNIIFERSLPLGLLTEKELVRLLQRLVSRHLDEDEVVAASLRRNAKGYAHLLEAHVDRRTPQTTIMVGENPHYVGTIRDA